MCNLLSQYNCKVQVFVASFHDKAHHLVKLLETFTSIVRLTKFFLRVP